MCWRWDGGGGKKQYRDLASIVYKYVRGMPTYGMICDQAQVRGMAAFQLVVRLHIDYPGADLQSFWAIAGQAECMALRTVFENLNSKTAFMAIFSSLSETSALHIRTSARIALEFLREKNDAQNIERYAGRWAKTRLTAEMRAWVEANRAVRKGEAHTVSYMTVEQSAELAAAMAQSLGAVNLSEEGGQRQ